MDEETLILENQLSFIMYACSKETIRRYKPYLDKVGLTYTQYIAMLVLWNEHPITVKDLGRKLFLDSGTLTPLLTKLETKGLVQKRRDPTDKRNVIVDVTENGFALKESVKDIPKEVLSLTGVPKEEAKQILEMLKSVLARVQ
ncbi:MarR family winged helix-turn-helix transcriptional regulator [Listeria ilorinensis]|uniref:MarR family winged helix-turn-helix transcriptional regulator n=1 Tax=Listeria ilorinensis TaxID=2867439 RepID=UPI001EF64A06|nr:MarR family transcriptional regulator [Listeria ilorinensis]